MNRASESLLGSIERVAFHNADKGFAVLKLAGKGQRDLITVVGHLGSEYLQGSSAGLLNSVYFELPV